MGRKKMKVILSFAAKSAKKVKAHDDEHNGHPHIKAQNRLQASWVDQETHIKLDRKKKNRTRACEPNIILRKLDHTFPPSNVPIETKLFYDDPKGIQLDYPEDTEYITRLLSDLTIITDHTNVNNFNVVVGHDPEAKNDEKTFVVLKVSKAEARVKDRAMKDHNLVLEKLHVTMQHVRRGGMRTGVNSKYICFGWRKNPLDCELGEYATHARVSAKEKTELKKGVVELVKAIEGRSLKGLERGRMDGHGSGAYAQLQEKFNLPRISEDGVATQLALAKCYCSPVHVDGDFYYSTLSCYDATADKNQTLYHFCFPTYGIAIPMRSGDIILFNPLVPHCATNPRVKTAMIYSFYVSKKTVNTHLANRDD